MKITINAKLLLKEIKQMKAAAPDKKAWMLSNVRMESPGMGDKDRVVLTRTNTETTIRKFVSCSMQGEGTLCINAEMLMKVLARFTGDIDIEYMIPDAYGDVSTDTASVSNAEKRYTLTAQDHARWPIIHESVDSYTPLCRFEESSMLMVINKLHKLTSHDVNRAILTHIKMDIRPKRIIFASTDGRKVGEISIKSKHHNQRMRKDKDGEIIHREILISAEACKALMDNIPKKGTQDLCSIYTCDGEPVFQVGHTWIYTTRPMSIQGANYPMYEKAFPDTLDSTIVISKAVLSAICNDAKMFNDGKVEARVHMTILSDRIDIHSKLNNEMMAQSIIPDKIAMDSSYEYKTAFNPAYMLEIIPAVSGDTATIKLETTVKGSPFIMTGDAENERYLLMPLRA